MKIKPSTIWAIIGLFIIIIMMNKPKQEEIRAQENASVKSDVDRALSSNAKAKTIQALEKTVRKIPASKLEANLKGYEKLLRLAPDNQFYMNKISFYKRKIVARTQGLAKRCATLNLSEKRERIKVPSDPSARYYLLAITKLTNGNLEVTTRRDGRSGKSYAIRLVQCDPLRFGYIAEGFDFGGREEIVKNLVRIKNPKLTKLVRGSISDVISRYACANLHRPVTTISLEPKTNTTSHPKKPPKRSTKEMLWIEKTKTGVKNRLKNPKSAKFRDIIFRYYQGKTPMVCGEVNSRNGFGGYTGFGGFIGSGSDFVFLESEFTGNEFSKTWNTLCKG